MNRFDLILADPPWPYHRHHDTRQIYAEHHYTLMSEEDIRQMRVRQHLTQNGGVLRWATGPKLSLALDTLRAWELHYRGIGGGVGQDNSSRPSSYIHQVANRTDALGASWRRTRLSRFFCRASDTRRSPNTSKTSSTKP